MSHHLLSIGRTHLLFLSSVLALLPACSLSAPDDQADSSEDIAGEAEQPLTSVRLRLMGANITSGNYQSYDPGEGIRIFKGIAPDVAMLQEFNYGTNSATDIRAFVDAAFGTSFSYYREGGAQIPNGIISRWPILESGEWDDASVTNRDFAWARIDIPGSVDLWAVSVHLLTSSSTSRNTEAQQLVSYIQGKVPASAYLVIGGDFNTGSRTEACITSLSQTVVTSGPYPADRNGNSGTNASRVNPYDWVLVDSDLSAYKTSVKIGASTFTDGLVADTRVYSPIAEISPALATDSGATNMQHMGIVRDFLIPSDGTPPPPPPGGAVFINEILANEPGSDPIGEFVEIVNGSTSTVDLSGYTVSDSASPRHTFAAGTVLGAGKAAVVFGGAAAIPFGLIGGVAASTGTLALSNSGDTVTIRDSAGTTVDTFTYASSLSGTDGVSMNRSPDGSSSSGFVLHSSLSASAASPGTRADGSTF